MPKMLFLLPLMLLFLSGCMLIAEKDNIVIAEVDGESITRGDYYRLLREMEDDQRPIIRNKGDVLRVLNTHIDSLITVPLGQQLSEEGKISVPREVARERYFQSKGEEADELRHIFNLDIAAAQNEQTELMEVYQLTPQALRARKDIIELKTDQILQEMLGQQAVAYLALQAYQKGELQADEAAVEREYALRKDELQTLEKLSFRAFRFPAAMPNALEEAAQVRRRLDAGENWETLETEYLLKNPNFVIESEIENNPELARFRGFWDAASGAQPGEIIGPIFMPSYQVMSQNAQGQTQPSEMPEAYLVMRVLESSPQRTMTLEEARPLLIPQVLVSQEMERLRDEHGVIIYEEDLPDPGAFASGDESLTF